MYVLCIPCYKGHSLTTTTTTEQPPPSGHWGWWRSEILLPACNLQFATNSSPKAVNMKTEPTIRNKKIRKFLLEKQLPEARVASLAPDGSIVSPLEDAVQVSAVNHVRQVRLETCRCTHLQEHLPHILDLELCKAVGHPRGWVVANPVHSMHLESQLELSGPPSKNPPNFYGEEQQRTSALNTEGIVEHWCPLDGYSAVIHDDTAMEKMEHMPTLQNIHPSGAGAPQPMQHRSSASLPSQDQQHLLATTSPDHLMPPPANLPTNASSASLATVGSNATPLTTASVPGAHVASEALDLTMEDEDSSLASTSHPTPVVTNNQPPPDTPGSHPEARQSTSHDNPPSVPGSPSTQATQASIGMELDSTMPPPADVAGTVSSNPLEVPAATANASAQPTTATPKQEPVPQTDTSGALNKTVSTNNSATTTAADPNAPATSSGDAALPNIFPPPEVVSSSVEDSQQEQKNKFNHWRLEEDRIRLIRHSLSSHRIVPKKKADTKKKRKREDSFKTTGIPGFTALPPKQLTHEQEDQWIEAMLQSRAKVANWLDNFRLNRETFWSEQQNPEPKRPVSSFYFPGVGSKNVRRSCQVCRDKPEGSQFWEGKKSSKPCRQFVGDDLMQCLECGFVACSPRSITPDSREHILQHLLTSGHKFAVSCGERGQIFCFSCGDFVYHEVFENERARADYCQKLPFMAWKHHAVYRSFDPYQFIKTEDHGIVWRGLVATYPQLVPQEHVRGTEMAMRRLTLFQGRVEEKWLNNKPLALSFAARQCLQNTQTKYQINAPVGIFNLGNTCYKSAVLQCLVHCKPLQEFFLKDNGHLHHSCKVYRMKEYFKKKKKKRDDFVCLACEMDKLYLSYFGSVIGKNVRGAVDEVCGVARNDDYQTDLQQGDPLVISEMLTSSWKCSGMSNLAGYKQHDAHEFLNVFLELLGAQSKKYWERISSAIKTLQGENAVVAQVDNRCKFVIKSTFEGSLNSVLLCEACGSKRIRHEEFLNVSLSLSDKVERATASGDETNKLSVESCLENFILPEELGDPVFCPACDKKTPTKKQHTFATLPKVLCLHLKRFDAAQNKKIDEFVKFPAKGLNMGKYLAQWCEVTNVQHTTDRSGGDPYVLYDLFGTVNHVGNMQSGHYVNHVKVGDLWYHCNDAHVSLAGGNGEEESVLTSDGAYILFYTRRQANITEESFRHTTHVR
eukprot:Nitzschia sp. Nitz4//scaffold96_size78090//25862//29503//NITZ4_005490-RA/size78090-augustus-gene-0.55-mRNA-1//1//CDS//3329560561//1494//frame0